MVSINRKIQIAAAIMGFSFAASSAFASGITWIMPNKTFLLGGNQNKAITIEGSNTGAAKVEISLSQGENVEVVETVNSKGNFSLIVPPQTIVQFRNESNTLPASLKLKITNDVASLSMRYNDGK